MCTTVFFVRSGMTLMSYFLWKQPIPILVHSIFFPLIFSSFLKFYVKNKVHIWNSNVLNIEMQLLKDLFAFAFISYFFHVDLDIVWFTFIELGPSIAILLLIGGTTSQYGAKNEETAKLLNSQVCCGSTYHIEQGIIRVEA
jgi:hypothetical protein